MKLLYPLAAGIREQLPGEAVFALPLDLDASGHSGEGFLVATEGAVHVFEGRALRQSLALAQIEALEVTAHLGIGELAAKNGESKRYLCSFSQKHLLRVTEFADLVTACIKSGEWTAASAKKEPACEKCGRTMPPEMSFCQHCTPKGKLFLRLLPLLKPYRRPLFFSVMFALLMESFWLLYPYVQRRLIDDYIMPQNADARGFLLWIGAGMLLFALTACCDVLSGRFSAVASTGVSEDLRLKVFAAIQALSLETVVRQPAGELMARVSKDAGKVETFLAEQGREAVLRVFSFLVLAVILFAMNWKFALFIVLPLPFALLMVQRIFRVIHKRYGQAWRAFGNSETKLHDMLGGIREVKLFGAERREAKAYEALSHKQAGTLRRAEIIWYVLFPLIGFVMALGEYLVLYFGGKGVVTGAMPIGELMQYVAYMYALYVPLRWAFSLPRNLAEMAVSVGKIYDVIDAAHPVSDAPQAKSLEIEGSVVLDNVSFGYQPYKKVLKNISFEVAPGEMIGIVGLSGTGKTTLIHLIMRLYDVTGGRLLIDGVDIRDIAQESLRRQIGVVLQETYLFEGTVLDNLRFAKPSATMVEVIRAAKLANAHEFILKLPEGYQTRVGNKGHTLSGGERQRIAIARALLPDPRILILDEATAALDTKTEALIQGALSNLMKGRTTFAIAHRLSTLKSANRLIVLDKGHLAQVGTHAELLAQKSGVYYDLVMAQRQTARLKSAPSETAG